MPCSISFSLEQKVAFRRIVGASLLLFFFFLPLHFHALDESRHISNECSCDHGTGTQLAWLPSSDILAVAPPVFFVTPEKPKAINRSSIKSSSARAPPLSL
jgi:hypothetical protein